ncbi:uncharacterized protein LOC134816564 [Bolinopsis microptera]|uniref:uncharacterized protein LOC134816564 n=1 Tax=Bolinopsis microptera TaxID=2820187 RepID=UPI00307A5B87
MALKRKRDEDDNPKTRYRQDSGYQSISCELNQFDSDIVYPDQEEVSTNGSVSDEMESSDTWCPGYNIMEIEDQSYNPYVKIPVPFTGLSCLDMLLSVEEEIDHTEQDQLLDELFRESENFSIVPSPLLGIEIIETKMEGHSHGFNDERKQNIKSSLDHDDIIWKLNVKNFDVQVMNLLIGCHAYQKFKVQGEKSGDTSNVNVKTWGISDFNWSNLKNILESDGDVEITKERPGRKQKWEKVERFCKRNIVKKRSVAFAENLIRGLALHEINKKLNANAKDVMDQKEQKALKNKFTNFSRRDRGAGKKLEEQFLNEHKVLNKFSGCREVDEYFNKITIFIFDFEGHLEYVSPTLCEESVYLYKGDSCEFFLIKNLKGFCRIED